jgi:hypothetical protein
LTKGPIRSYKPPIRSLQHLTDSFPHLTRVGRAPGRWLVTTMPLGFDRFVTAASGLDPADTERFEAVAAEHGVTILAAPAMLGG